MKKIINHPKIIMLRYLHKKNNLSHHHIMELYLVDLWINWRLDLIRCINLFRIRMLRKELHLLKDILERRSRLTWIDKKGNLFSFFRSILVILIWVKTWKVGKYNNLLYRKDEMMVMRVQENELFQENHNANIQKYNKRSKKTEGSYKP